MTKFYVFDLKTFTFIFARGEIKCEEIVTDQLNEICLIGIKKFPVYALVDEKLIIFSKKGDVDPEIIPNISEIPKICDYYNFENADTFDMSFERTLKNKVIALITKKLETASGIKYVHYEIE
jgi:hypothetical protein